MDENLQVLQKEVGKRAVEWFLRFSAGSHHDVGEVEASITWLDWAGAWVASVVGCFTARDTLECQSQKIYSDTYGKMPELSLE